MSHRHTHSGFHIIIMNLSSLSSLTEGGTFLLLSLPCRASTWEVWEERLPLKTEAKGLSPSAFSIVISLTLILIVEGYAFPSLYGWHICYSLHPCQVQLQMCLGLPDSIFTQRGSLPILFPGYLSLVPLPCISFLALSLMNRSWFSHAEPSLPGSLHAMIKSPCTLWKGL